MCLVLVGVWMVMVEGGSGVWVGRCGRLDDLRSV